MPVVSSRIRGIYAQTQTVCTTSNPDWPVLCSLS